MKIKTRMTAWFMTMLMLTSMLCMVQTVLSDEVTSVYGEDISCNIGETFDYTVMCYPTEPIGAWETKIYFDPDIVTVNDVSCGDIFEPYSQFFSDGTIDNINGTIVDIFNVILGNYTVEDSGSLFIINFTAEGQGVSAIEFIDSGITNRTAYIESDWFDGEISVSDCYAVELYDGWNMITTPWMDTIYLSDILIGYDSINYTWSQAVSSNIISGTLFGWNGLVYTMETTSISGGHGFWLWSYYDAMMYVFSPESGDGIVAYPDDDCFSLIGLSYPDEVNKTELVIEYNSTDYNWSQAVSANLITNHIYGWDAEDTPAHYFLGETLYPGSAYWMYAYEEVVVKLPSGRFNSVPFDELDWEADVLISVCESEYNARVYLGEAEDATDEGSPDEYDAPLPPAPPFTPYVRAWFDANMSYPFDKLLRDIKESPGIDEEKEWTLKVIWIPDEGEEPAPGVITWSITEFERSSYSEVELQDSSHNTLADMLSVDYYQTEIPANTVTVFYIWCST